MEITREQAEARLNSPENLANKIKIFREGKKLQLDIDSNVAHATTGKGSHLPRLPKPVVQDIKEAALSGLMTQKEIAKEYGISQAAVSYQKREEEDHLSNQEISVMREVRERAVDKMLIALGLVTEEKLQKLGTRDLISAAKDLSMTHNYISPKDKNQAANVNLIVYSPEVRSEDSFKVIEISSSER